VATSSPTRQADFQPESYGFRPKRTAHDAVDRVARAIIQHKTRVIDIDLRSYFDNVRHSKPTAGAAFRKAGLSHRCSAISGRKASLRYARRRPALTLPITDAEPEAPIASTVRSGSPFKAASRRLAKDRGSFSGSGFRVPWNMT
jgi:hypothetical protein